MDWGSSMRGKRSFLSRGRGLGGGRASIILSFSLDPKHRLRDGDVAFDFRVGRKWQFFPEVEILRFVEREASEEQARLPRGPAVPCLYVRLARPLGFVGEERIHELHRQPHPASAVRQGVEPKILVARRK